MAEKINVKYFNVLYYLHNTYKFNDIVMATDDSDELQNKMNDQMAWMEFLLTEKILYVRIVIMRSP